MQSIEESLAYPQPPAHYEFLTESPTRLQPPDISQLGPTYRMFGQVVQNPFFSSDVSFPAPPIDRDVLLYDPKNGLKIEIIRLVGSLRGSVVNLLRSVENKPTQASRELRDLDNRVKSIFHALESLRPFEASQAMVRLGEKEVSMRSDMNLKCTDILTRCTEYLALS
jgi:hypothetical protein